MQTNPLILLFLSEITYYLTLPLCHLRNWETISFLKNSKSGKFRDRSKSSQWYNSWEFLNKSHTSTYPPWILTWGFWIVVLRCRIKLSLISMRLSDNLSYTNYSWSRTVGVIKKYFIPPTHAIAHRIASLIITNPKPTWDTIFLKIIYWIPCGFWFHQPILHILQSYQIILSRNIASPKEKNPNFLFNFLCINNIVYTQKISHWQNISRRIAVLFIPSYTSLIYIYF